MGSQTEVNEESVEEPKKEKQEIRSEYKEARKNMRQLQSEIKRIDDQLILGQQDENAGALREEKSIYSAELQRLSVLALKTEEEKVMMTKLTVLGGRREG